MGSPTVLRILRASASTLPLTQGGNSLAIYPPFTRAIRHIPAFRGNADPSGGLCQGEDTWLEIVHNMSRGRRSGVGLMNYVRALENRDNPARRRRVLAALRELGIEPVVQESRLLRVSNIAVDLPPGPGARRLLFSAHYDAVRGSPGANDNASGVAVLLGLCHKLKDGRFPIRAVFFDREEAWLRTPLLRAGLLGSFHYVWKNGLREVAAVYNLEFCGMGDYLGVWPIRSKEMRLRAFQEVGKAAARLALPMRAAHIPWFILSSDHLPFRLRGLPDALTLSLFPSSQVPGLEKWLEDLPRLLVGGRSAWPEPLSSIHTARDTSSRLSEGSLALMLTLLLDLSEGWGFSPGGADPGAGPGPRHGPGPVPPASS